MDRTHWIIAVIEWGYGVHIKNKRGKTTREFISVVWISKYCRRQLDWGEIDRRLVQDFGFSSVSGIPRFKQLPKSIIVLCPFPVWILFATKPSRKSITHNVAIKFLLVTGINKQTNHSNIFYFWISVFNCFLTMYISNRIFYVKYSHKCLNCEVRVPNI